MDPRFKDWAARTEHVGALREVIEGALASDDPKTWETRLTAADVPCACIWKIDEIVEHPQLESRDVLQTIDSRYGPMRLVGAGFRLAHGSPGIERQPPTLGEHTDEILGEAGYSKRRDRDAPPRPDRLRGLVRQGHVAERHGSAGARSAGGGGPFRGPPSTTHAGRAAGA